MFNNYASQQYQTKKAVCVSLIIESVCDNYDKLWNVLGKMEIRKHLIVLMQNLYTGKVTSLEHGNTDWLQRGKGLRQGCEQPINK